MELQKILDIFEKNGFNECNCSYFKQEDIADIAKELLEAINYSRCCKSDSEHLDADFVTVDGKEAHFYKDGKIIKKEKLKFSD